MKQSTALDILKTGQNVFLTGSAGSGKTYTLNQYIHYLRARRVPVAITASTGIAATHMNGITIHSWSGIGIKSEMTDTDLIKLIKRKPLKERIEDTAVLIIDEISMLHAKQLQLVNTVLKYIRKSEDAFGGMQVVLAGDFFQLPPIGENDESNREKFAFMSPAWLEASFQICYLSEQFRQKQAVTDTVVNSNEAELTLNDILNQIRSSSVTHQAIYTLESTYSNQINDNRTRLFTHNVSVDRINQTELSKLTSDSRTYTGIMQGDSKLAEMLKKNVRTSEKLTLKVGSKVMFIKNINDLNVFNGTMGEVIGFHAVELENNYVVDESIDDDFNDDIDDDIDEALNKHSRSSDASVIQYPIVRLNTGREVIATPEQWLMEDEQGTVLASYSQVPLCLAWAITIHKSQGMTLDAAEIDLSRTFEMGQGYVALSRLQSLSGLKLLGLAENSLRLDPLARGADKRFIELSDELQRAHELLDKQTLTKAHEAFVLKSGGTTNQKLIDGYEINRKKRQQQQIERSHKITQGNNSANTLEETKKLLQESLSIDDISQQRGLAQSTIMSHISKLKQQYSNLPCEHLRPEDSLIEQVQEAYDAIVLVNDPNDFSEDGQMKLRPIYEHLKETISWNGIRLALIFINKTTDE